MAIRTVKCIHEDNIKNCLDCWEKFTGERVSNIDIELDKILDTFWCGAVDCLTSKDFKGKDGEIDEAKYCKARTNTISYSKESILSHYIARSEVEEILKKPSRLPKTQHNIEAVKQGINFMAKVQHQRLKLRGGK